MNPGFAFDSCEAKLTGLVENLPLPEIFQCFGRHNTLGNGALPEERDHADRAFRRSLVMGLVDAKLQMLLCRDYRNGGRRFL